MENDGPNEHGAREGGDRAVDRLFSEYLDLTLSETENTTGRRRELLKQIMEYGGDRSEGEHDR